jgi:hypothetical protein
VYIAALAVIAVERVPGLEIKLFGDADFAHELVLKSL